MDKMREQHIREMHRLKDAISKSTSKYLIRDYTKKYKQMQIELKEYDEYKRKAVSISG